MTESDYQLLCDIRAGIDLNNKHLKSISESLSLIVFALNLTALIGIGYCGWLLYFKFFT